MNTITKPHDSEAVYLAFLTRHDRFVLPGRTSVYTVESKRVGDAQTTINYRTIGGRRNTFTKPNLSTVYRLTD